MKLVQGPGLLAEIAGLCGTSERARMAVAFWGDGAADALGLKQGAAGVSIVCNLRMGGTNPHEIRKLRDLGASVRHLDALHAKIYLFDEVGAVGSSNASANGLSMEGAEVGGWSEANVLFGPGSLYGETEALFEQIWADAREVSDNDLATAQKIWDDRRGVVTRNWKSSASNMLEALKTESSLLAIHHVYITVDFSDMSQEAKNIVAKEQKDSNLGDKVDAWECWPEMPNRAFFVSFYSDKGGISGESFWRSPHYRREVMTSKGDPVSFVDRAPSICGIRKLGPLPEWRKIIRRLVEAKGSGSLICIKADEFAEKYIHGIG